MIDTWAFSAADSTEYMAMDATRVFNLRMTPRVGDALVTNRRREILVLDEDTSPGRHDTMMAACDRWRYHLLGFEGIHDNCSDNLASAMAELGIVVTHTPSPLNLFMNIPWDDSGDLRFEPPLAHPGDHVVLRARMDCIVAMSACPPGHGPRQRSIRPTNRGAFRDHSGKLGGCGCRLRQPWSAQKARRFDRLSRWRERIL